MLKKIWNNWKSLAQAIGNFQFQVIFSLLYFILIFPLGLLITMIYDPFDKRKVNDWIKMKDNTGTLEKMKLQ